MTEPAAPITIALRIPGKWSHPRELIERLPVYPKHAKRPEFFDPKVYEAVQRAAADDFHARPRMNLEAA